MDECNNTLDCLCDRVLQRVCYISITRVILFNSFISIICGTLYDCNMQAGNQLALHSKIQLLSREIFEFGYFVPTKLRIANT